MRVIDAPDVIEMAESPAKALRKKPRASIRVAAEHVAAGHAARCSAPATPARAWSRRMRRSACCPASIGRRWRRRCRPGRARRCCSTRARRSNASRQHLLQFAHMGAMYARVGLGIEQPRIGLLSIGEEETKGNELTREAHQLLKASALTFIGNVEARGIFSGDADVVVCDGFTGNVALKLSEGPRRDGRGPARRGAAEHVLEPGRLPAVAAGVPPVSQARRLLGVRRRAAARRRRPLHRRPRPLVGEGGAQCRGDGVADGGQPDDGAAHDGEMAARSRWQQS